MAMLRSSHRMSAWGQSLPKWTVRVMSGLPPLAAELRTFQIGSFVPTADTGATTPLTKFESSLSFRRQILPNGHQVRQIVACEPIRIR